MGQRQWLAGHHRSKQEIWVAFSYKHTGKPTIAYDDAVEEGSLFAAWQAGE